MLTEDPANVLTQIREGTHEISGATCMGQPLTLVNSLFQRAAADRGPVSVTVFESGIRELAVNLVKTGAYPENCAGYVKLVEDKIFSGLPKG